MFLEVISHGVSLYLGFNEPLGLDVVLLQKFPVPSFIS